MLVSHLHRWHQAMRFLLAHQDRPKACALRAVAADVTQAVPRPVLCVRALARFKWVWVAVEHSRPPLFIAGENTCTLFATFPGQQHNGLH